MTVEQLCHRYLAALDTGDLAAIEALFVPGGVVVSPLYGTRPAPEFYAELFADTSRSDTELLNIFPASSSGSAVALHFRYRWTLADGTPVAFEVVDVIELSADRSGFEKLTIIYDTAPLRPEFEAVHRRRTGAIGGE